MTTAQTSEQPKRGRGRPPGSKNKAKSGADTKAADKTTEHDRVHLEDLTDEQEYALFCQHRKAYDSALDKKKAADAELKNVAKKAKAELGPNVIDQIKLAHSLDSDEGKRFLKERIEWQAKVARWVGMPVGHIDDLFATEDRTPIDDRAYAEGKRAGLAGEDRSAPHYAGTQLQCWLEGHAEGQAILAKGFKPIVGATFGVPPEAEDTDVEKNGTYWLGMGRVAFEHGQNGECPDDVPADHREDWIAGWKNASAAQKHGQGTKRDYHAEGATARENGVGCSVPPELSQDAGEAWHSGWRARDAELQRDRAAA